MNADQLVAHYDADLDSYTVVAAPSGPAGVAPIELAAGPIAIDFDVARPDTISQIEVTNLGDPDVERALVVLTGIPDLAERLRGATHEPKVVWTADDLTRRRTPNGASALGRIALCRSEHDSARRPRYLRNLAAEEVQELLATLDPTLGPLVDRFVVDLPTPAVGAAEIVSHAAAAPMALMAEMSAPAPVARRSRTARGRPVAVALDPDIDITVLHAHLDDGILTVGATQDDRPLFVRAFTRDGVPLALVPFAESSFDGALATAVVPRKHDAVAVEITADPGAPHRSDGVRNVMRATRLGHDAARLTRRDGSAPDAWRRCAEAWRAAGDERRAEIADAYETNPPTTPPLRADRA